MQKDTSMKNTNLETHEGTAGNANPHTHIEKVDIEKERDPNVPEVIKTDLPDTQPANEAK